MPFGFNIDGQKINARPRTINKFSGAGIFTPPPPPFITATNGFVEINNITGLSYTEGQGPSAGSAPFKIMAGGLIPTSGNITVTPTSSFEVYDGSTWQASAFTIPYTGGTLDTAIIYMVRIKAGFTSGPVSGTVTLSGANAADFVITVSGNVDAIPSVITISSNSLSFGNVYPSTNSTQQSYNVSATGLTANLVITPPSQFLISLTSGSGYSSSAITIIPSGGVVSSTPIYVIFNPAAIQSYSDNISNASTGATTKNVAVSGTGAVIVATGGTITTSGNRTIHTFTASGTFQITTYPQNAPLWVLVVAGGGGGGGHGGGGGGGAGGVVENTSFLPSSGAASYSIGVGAGGAGAPAPNGSTPGTNGTNSTFDTITAIGGGGGGSNSAGTGFAGASGGSGGGGAGGTVLAASGASGTVGQGNNGGNGFSKNSAPAHGNGGGGGGASTVGTNGVSGQGGAGGAGVSSSISGSAVTYGGGGGGGGIQPTADAPGLGGAGGGGNGSGNDNPASNGTANRGGGGGGAGFQSTGGPGGNGGSGIVIISYVSS